MSNFPLKNSNALSPPQPPLPSPLQKKPLPVGISPEQPHHPRGIISQPTNQEQIPLYSSSSQQQPNHHSAGIPSRNLSYDEFIAAEEQQRSSLELEDPVTGFPISWPKVSPPPPPKVVASPPPSPEKGFSAPSRTPPSPANVPRNVPPPSPPPSPSRSCSCCIIL